MKEKNSRNCSIDGCNRPHEAKSYCNIHYMRWKRYGDPLKIADPNATRRKISESKKGKPLSYEHSKKIQESLKKRKPHPHSIEALKKANLARKGTRRPDVGKKSSLTLKKKWANTEFKNKMIMIRRKQFSNPEIKSKISKSLKNLWNNSEYRNRQSKSHKGIIAGMSGKKHSIETRKKLSESHKGQIPWSVGKPLPQITRKRISIKIKKWFQDHPEERKIQSIKVQKWLKEHPEFREQAIERRANQVFPFKDSKPEIQIQTFLQKHNIQFKKHIPIRLENRIHQVDLLIEPNRVIEVFGDYWHANPSKYNADQEIKLRKKIVQSKEVWNYDETLINEMKKLGYNVLVVWESELKKNKEETMKKVLRFATSRFYNLGLD